MDRKITLLGSSGAFQVIDSLPHYRSSVSFTVHDLIRSVPHFEIELLIRVVFVSLSHERLDIVEVKVTC
jgi:hypothetical protein